MYADYSFYTETYYGTEIKAADFPRLASRASDFLDYYTRGKAAKVTDEDVLTLLGKACCAIAEAIQTDERNRALQAQSVQTALAGSGEIKSESVGSYSVSYTTSADYKANGAEAERVQRAVYAMLAQYYLADTNLLYRGSCCQCTPLTP